tara:strand:+ start:915 stop:1169 length:255 start_codon:yes stop_codon:yes gene_type:complete
MIRTLRIWLWSIAAELEYRLYPWKTDDVPQWAVERYNLDHGIVDEYEDHMHYSWLKSLEDRTAKLQLEMINVIGRLNKIEHPDG